MGTINSVTDIVTEQSIRSIVIALPRWDYSRIAQLISELSELSVNVHVVPDYFDTAFFNFTVDTLGGIPVIGLREPAIDGFQRVVKRVVDLLLGSIAVLAGLPLLAALAAAIWLEDRGPIFYWADRVGENREPFRMLKLRSMSMGADALQGEVNETDEAGNVIHKQPDDPRVTRVGRFIRRYSLDELPNLWNVLKGEMSLVGPRPELPWLVEKYEPWQLKRFAVPQGHDRLVAGDRPQRQADAPPYRGRHLLHPEPLAVAGSSDHVAGRSRWWSGAAVPTERKGAGDGG